MLQKLLATAAFTLALSLSAVAQDASSSGANNPGGEGDTSSTTGASDPMPPGWEGPIADVFYSDVTARTMREQDDMATSWAALTADQQAQVKTSWTGMTANADTFVMRACEGAGNN